MSRAELAEQLATQEDFFAPLIYEPDGVTFTEDELAGVPVEWTAPAGGATDDGLVVIYQHGGGYSSGISKWARRGTARLATALGARVVAPDYRLAPATRSPPPTRTCSPCSVT